MQIIDDNQGMVNMLTKALGNDLPDAILVQLCYIESGKQNRVDFHGLDVAIDMAKTGRPVIVYGTLPLGDVKKMLSRFTLLMALDNAGYVDLIGAFTPDDFPCIFKEIYSKLEEKRNKETSSSGVSKMKIYVHGDKKSPVIMALTQVAKAVGGCEIVDNPVSANRIVCISPRETLSLLKECEGMIDILIVPSNSFSLKADNAAADSLVKNFPDRVRKYEVVSTSGSAEFPQLINEWMKGEMK